MKKINTIIVDDESSGIQVVEFFCGKTPKINLLKTFQNPIEAINYFELNDVDLIFLDVQMPEMSGIEFLKRVNGRASVIIASADDPNKFIGFDINSVLDYLSKPIAFDNFQAAIDRYGK